MSEYRPIYGASYALVIGIDTYSDARFVTLGQAEADAQSVTDLLAGQPFSFQITQLLGAQATRQSILDALFGLRRVDSDDRLLIYFAGHGYTLIDRLGNETGYLAASDTIPEKDYTALSLDDIIALTRHSPAKHIAFVFDACYSGQALGLTRAPAASTDKLLVRRAYQVMSAGAGDQTVSDYRSMTGVLIQALQSGLMNQDGLVTFSEIGLYLQQTITAESRMTQIPQFGHLRGSQGGEFVFYEDHSVRLPRDVVAMLASERAVARQGAVVALIELARGDDPVMAAMARNQLASLSSEDPDPRVRATAARYLQDTQDQLFEVDINPAPRVRPPTPSPSAPLYEPPAVATQQVSYSDVQAAQQRSVKPAKRKSRSRWVWLLPVAAIVSLVCVIAIAAIAIALNPPVATNQTSTPTEMQAKTATSQPSPTPTRTTAPPAFAVATRTPVPPATETPVQPATAVPTAPPATPVE